MAELRGASRVASPPSHYVPCSSQLDLSKDRIGDLGAAELAKAIAANRSLTTVCCAHRVVRLGGHPLPKRSQLAGSGGCFGAPVQLWLSRDSMSADAQDRLDHARPGFSISWWS